MNRIKKSSFFAISFVILMVFLANTVDAQQYTIYGKQEKGTSTSNPQLTCTGIKLTKQVKIVSVSGSNAGFWITNGKTMIKQYYSPNDKSAVGYVLSPGTYYVYPRLQSTQSVATVTVGLN